jgi:hypothetical protein
MESTSDSIEQQDNNISFEETIIPTIHLDTVLPTTEITSVSSEPPPIYEPTLEELAQLHEIVLQQEIADLTAEIDAFATTLEQTLSAHQMHPWDALTLECVPPNTAPLTLDDIKVPEDFTATETIPDIIAIGDSIDETSNFHLQAFENPDINNDNIGNVFTVLSGDTFVIDKPKAAKFIQFTNLLRNLPFDAAENDPLGTAKKLLYHYVSLYK